jgi:predicted amino acid racemase
MKYPYLTVDLNKIEKNARYITDLCNKNDIEVVGVTKGCCGIPEVAKVMLKGGVKYIADSRLDNLKKIRMSGYDKELMLLRMPMKSEFEEVVDIADMSLNSELETIKELSDIAKYRNRLHKIILMIDLGELREGILIKNVKDYVKQILELDGIEFLGIGTNLACFSGVLPTYENMRELVDLKDELEDFFNIKIPIVSGGNTSALKLIEDNKLPAGINQFRVGEAILIGRDVSRNRIVPGTYQDTFILVAQIIELKEKPSVPKGELGRDAFGNIPKFVNKGIIKRAILALGKQDVDIKGLTPLIDGVEIIGASSDHLVLDITKSPQKIELNQEVRFKLNYSALLSACTSPYITKKFLSN